MEVAHSLNNNSVAMQLHFFQYFSINFLMGVFDPLFQGHIIKMVFHIYSPLDLEDRNSKMGKSYSTLTAVYL